MPCFSRIINTQMSLTDNIIKAVKEFGWQIEVGKNSNYINIMADRVRINLSRSNDSENFKTTSPDKEYLAALQRQYNVVNLRNWADRMNYEVKETKKEIRI